MKEVATVILEDENGLYLVGKRREDKPFPGKFEFLGGKIENGETVLEAAMREICEETSLPIESFILVGVLGHVISEPTPGKKFKLNLVHLKLIKNKEIIIATAHSELVWKQKEEIMQLDLVSEANRQITELL